MVRQPGDPPVKLSLPPRARAWTTDADAPLRQNAYLSPLRDERVAAILGATLGILFSVSFLTGLYSYLQQSPQPWFPIPTRPIGLYRLTQGIHVATGIASVPVLLAKLWIVWPRFVSLPVVKRASHLVERAGLFFLVGGAIFMTFSGVANISQWYPWPFSFRASHFWMAWVTMGALTAHLGAKWYITRRSLTRPSRRPALCDADPVLATVAERPPVTSGPGPAASSGLSRRGFLGTVATASGVLTATTVGQTFPPLRRLAILAPRDPAVGSQGRPVNRSARNAGVLDLASAPQYRLVVSGRVSQPLSFDVEQLMTLPYSEAGLPLSCVEGWSYSARWRGIPVRDLLSMAGAERGRMIRVQSLETNGRYTTSTLNPGQAASPLTLLATHFDDKRLSLDHGFPCRLIAPNRPGVLQTKWVTRLEVL